MRVFWCLSFGSVPHHRGVTFPASSSKQTRPDCVTLLSIQILILLLSPSSDPNIILRAASGHSIQLIVCYWHRERIHLCNAMINIYISDRYSMSSPPSIFRLCLYLCVITRPTSAADEDQIVKNGTLQAAGKETKWVLFSISTDSNISVTVCNSKPCVLREAGRELSLSIIWNISFCSCNERECDVEISSSSQMTGWKETRWRWQIQDKQGVTISIVELKITREFYSPHSITFHETYLLCVMKVLMM